MTRVFSLVAGAILVCGLTTGCVSSVTGTAVRDQSAGPIEQPQLKELDLNRILLTAGAINKIMDATGMRVAATSEQMTDNSSAVSDRDCLAAIYGAEQLVYAGTDWSAVRDQVVQEPDDDNHHWVEQTAVLYPSTAKAQEFVESSKKVWQPCSGRSIDIDHGDVHATWDFGDFRAEEPKSGLILTQITTQRKAGGWDCQHALTSTSNVVVEVWACTNGIQDEAQTIAEQMQKNAE